jgi:hypothetical protein
MQRAATSGLLLSRFTNRSNHAEIKLCSALRTASATAFESDPNSSRSSSFWLIDTCNVCRIVALACTTRRVLHKCIKLFWMARTASSSLELCDGLLSKTSIKAIRAVTNSRLSRIKFALWSAPRPISDDRACPRQSKGKQAQETIPTDIFHTVRSHNRFAASRG